MAGRVRHEAFDGVAHTVLFSRHDEEDPRCVFLQDLLCLGVQFDAGVRVGFTTGSVEQFVNAVVGVEGTVAGVAELAAVEQRVQAVVGVTGHGDPAEDEHVVQTGGGVGEVGAPLDYLDVNLNADVGEFGLDDLGDLHALRVVVGPDAGAEAVRVAGFGQQLTCQLGVVRVRLEIQVGAEDVTGDRADGTLGLAGVDGIDDQVDVDRMVDGPTDQGIIERLLLDVEADVGGREGTDGHEVHVVVGLCAAGSGRRQGVSDVDTTGLEFDAADGALGDRTEDQGLGEDVAAPPVVVALQDDAVAGLPAVEDERTGTYDDAGAVIVTGGLDGVLVHDAQAGVRQVVQDRSEGELKLDLYGVIVKRFHRADGVKQERGVRGQAHEAFVRPDDIGCREVVAVVPGHVSTQVEHPAGVIDGFPALGQARVDLEVVVPDDQGVVALACDLHGRLDVGVMQDKGDSTGTHRYRNGLGADGSEYEAAGQGQCNDFLQDILRMNCC